MTQGSVPVPGPGGDAGAASQRKRSGALGVVSIVLAAIGTVFAAWEGAYIIGWVLLPAAFIVSIVAIALGSRRRLAIGALVLSIVGTVVGVVAFANSVGKAVDETFGTAPSAAASQEASASGDAGETSEAGTGEADDAAAPGDAAAPSFADGVYRGQGVTIQITGHHVLQPGEGGNEFGDKPLLVIEYSMTNDSATTEVNPAMFVLAFRVYQDNDPNTLNELQLGVDASVLDTYGDVGTQAIKQGGTVEYAQAYELTDTTTPVDVVAESLLGGEIGRMQIPLP